MLRAMNSELFVNHRRGRDRGLELSPVNEECLVNAREKHALTMSLIFVHTARRSSIRMDWRVVQSAVGYTTARSPASLPV